MDNQQKTEGKSRKEEVPSTDPNNTFSSQPPEEQQTSAPETAAPAQENEQTGQNSKLTYAIVVAVVAALLVGAYLFATNSDVASDAEQTGNQNAANADLSELLDLEKVDPVARVNGETLSWKDYEQSLNEILQNATASGVDVNNPQTQSEIKSQALTSLVNTELLIQAAQESGINAEEGEVENEYAHIQEQVGGEAALDKMLSDFELTSDELRANIAEQIAINDYIAEEVNPSSIEISEEEVQAVYDQASGGAQEGQLPPLEEVRGAIESQIQSTKQQNLVASLIETLREAAEIETMI